MTVTVTGEIEQIGEVQTFDSGFEKQAVLVKELEGKYPNTYQVEFTKDNIAKVDGLTLGQKVSLECNLRSNEHKGRHFLSLNAWRVND